MSHGQLCLVSNGRLCFVSRGQLCLNSFQLGLLDILQFFLGQCRKVPVYELQVPRGTFSHKSDHAVRKSAVDFAVVAEVLQKKFVQ